LLACLRADAHEKIKDLTPITDASFSAELSDHVEVHYQPVRLEEIERFRYDIYIAEQHLSLPSADHAKRRLTDAEDKYAYHFCVRDAAKTLIGYSRMRYADAIPASVVTRLELRPYLKKAPKTIGSISRLMVHKSIRGGTCGVRLVKQMIEYGCQHFPEAEGAVFQCTPELVPLYTRLGFRPFGKLFSDPLIGTQVPMVTIFRDVAHFRPCKSPILPISASLLPRNERVAQLQHYFLVQRAFNSASMNVAEACK
jgi:predicted GNAT family N-acyltransferase